MKLAIVDPFDIRRFAPESSSSMVRVSTSTGPRTAFVAPDRRIRIVSAGSTEWGGRLVVDATAPTRRTRTLPPSREQLRAALDGRGLRGVVVETANKLQVWSLSWC